MTYPNPIVDLYYFYLKAPFSLIATKVMKEGRKLWECSSRGGLHALSTLWEAGDALHSASCCTRGLFPLHLHASADTWSLDRLTVIVWPAERRQPLLCLAHLLWNAHIWILCGRTELTENLQAWLINKCVKDAADSVEITFWTGCYSIIDLLPL